jgi:hypothetical protein
MALPMMNPPAPQSESRVFGHRLLCTRVHYGNPAILQISWEGRSLRGFMIQIMLYLIRNEDIPGCLLSESAL